MVHDVRHRAQQQLVTADELDFVVVVVRVVVVDRPGCSSTRT